MSDPSTWRGYWPAAPTPFSPDGSIDFGAWRALVDLYLDYGVHGLLVNGTAGEWSSQTAEERVENVRVVVEQVGGRIPVIAGCTGLRPDDVIEVAASCVAVGASGVLSTPPPYLRPEQDDIVAFYSAIAPEVGAPLLAYNWPRGTGVEISVDTARRISELDNVAGFKQSSPDLAAVVDYLEAFGRTHVVFASIISPRGLALWRQFGGSGYIDGGALGAQFAVPFFEALWSGDFDAAAAHGASYSALMSALVEADFGGRYGSAQAQLKAAMALLGQPGGSVRRPLLPITDDARLRGLEADLRRSGLLG